MQCLECGAAPRQLDNAHLLQCCGLTLHEYALRHCLPLDLLLSPERLNVRAPRALFARPRVPAGETARGVLLGLKLAGLARRREGYQEIPGDIRRLDLLLWAQRHLGEFGFRFCQEYRFDQSSNRVVAENCLRALEPWPQAAHAQLSLAPPPDFRLALAVCLAFVGELHGGYLFLPVNGAGEAAEIQAWLQRRDIELLALDAPAAQGKVLLRARTLSDTDALFALLHAGLRLMPGAWERFHAQTPRVTVVKEVVFDSAHFITDHPAKCSNLHGGRYKLQVKVADRVDPVTGCVIDYGYLKRVVNRRIVERFDHHTLNYVAPELAWRSSTEMLCVYIWEQLIDYLPGMLELQLYETEQSWCHYRGPDLAQFQARGGNPLLQGFAPPEVGDRAQRQRLLACEGVFDVVA